MVVVTVAGRPYASYWYDSWNPGDDMAASVPTLRLAADVPHVQVVTPSGSVRWIGCESLSYAKLVTCPRRWSES
jgi:hypothetical protein